MYAIYKKLSKPHKHLKKLLSVYWHTVCMCTIGCSGAAGDDRQCLPQVTFASSALMSTILFSQIFLHSVYAAYISFNTYPKNTPIMWQRNMNFFRPQYWFTHFSPAWHLHKKNNYLQNLSSDRLHMSLFWSFNDIFLLWCVFVPVEEGFYTQLCTLQH